MLLHDNLLTKIPIVISLIICSLAPQIVEAQIQVNSTHAVGAPSLSDIDSLIIFKDISQASILINSEDTADFVWTHFYFDGNNYNIQDSIYTTLQSNQSINNNLQAGGYIISKTTEDTTINMALWLIDYATHQALTIDTLTIDDKGNNGEFDPCSRVQIHLQVKRDRFFYYNTPFAGDTSRLEIMTRITYPELSSTATILDNTLIEADAPTEKVQFEIAAREHFIFANNFISNQGFGSTTYTSELYSPVALGILNIQPNFPQVSANSNELDKFSNEGKTYKASTPAEVYFSSDAPEHASDFAWALYKKQGTQAPILITRFEGPEFLFSFRDADTFMITLQVSNERCDTQDSIVVIAHPSLVAAPNTFTPNGDGINDVFKVAYRSLKSFEGIIYNRWGKKIYSWTDPSKGWDGNTGGGKASPGVYFYVIRATGSQAGREVSHDIKGEINLIRD